MGTPNRGQPQNILPKFESVLQILITVVILQSHGTLLSLHTTVVEVDDLKLQLRVWVQVLPRLDTIFVDEVTRGKNQSDERRRNPIATRKREEEEPKQKKKKGRRTEE